MRDKELFICEHAGRFEICKKCHHAVPHEWTYLPARNAPCEIDEQIEHKTNKRDEIEADRIDAGPDVLMPIGEEDIAKVSMFYVTVGKIVFYNIHESIPKRDIAIKKLLKNLGELSLRYPNFYRKVTIKEILEINGVKEAFDALRLVENRDNRIFDLIAADIAESVINIWNMCYPHEKQPQAAIMAARYGKEVADGSERETILIEAIRAVENAIADGNKDAADAAAAAVYALYHDPDGAAWAAAAATIDDTAEFKREFKETTQ